MLEESNEQQTRGNNVGNVGKQAVLATIFVELILTLVMHNSCFISNNMSSKPLTNQTCTFKNIECKVGITRNVQMHEELFWLVRSRQNHSFLGALLAA
jgi:hypothetical protein